MSLALELLLNVGVLLVLEPLLSVRVSVAFGVLLVLGVSLVVGRLLVVKAPLPLALLLALGPPGGDDFSVCTRDLEVEPDLPEVVSVSLIIGVPAVLRVE